MTNPIKTAAENWEAKAIASCMADPAYAAKVESGDWCAACDMGRPCLCDGDRAVKKMRAYYEANRRIEKTTFFGGTTIVRAEPTSVGSWGVIHDAFMEELYKIATEKHQQEIRRLQRRMSREC